MNLATRSWPPERNQAWPSAVSTHQKPTSSASAGAWRQLTPVTVSAEPGGVRSILAKRYHVSGGHQTRRDGEGGALGLGDPSSQQVACPRGVLGLECNGLVKPSAPRRSRGLLTGTPTDTPGECVHVCVCMAVSSLQPCL